MHARLVASALQVFASKGFDATDIEDVIAAAEVSRGTFYNYFKTNEELMQAVIEAVSHEMLTLIDAVVLPKPDPASRIASGLRLVLHTTCRHRLFANFVTRMGVDQTLRHSLAIQYLQRDLQAGMDEGRFAMKDARLGLLLVLGTAHATIMAFSLNAPLPDDICEEVTYHVLLGLGMTKSAARKLVSAPLEEVPWPANSFLARTQDLLASSACLNVTAPTDKPKRQPKGASKA
jgi:AcrR family transcriptional regulator